MQAGAAGITAPATPGPLDYFPSPGAMNTSLCGNFWNSAADLPKLVASTSTGLPAIHSDRSISS
jgi:hypothetical protein